jgi:hypothetical protein
LKLFQNLVFEDILEPLQKIIKITKFADLSGSYKGSEHADLGMRRATTHFCSNEKVILDACVSDFGAAARPSAVPAPPIWFHC